MERKTSVFSNALIWFGAAVSIAEILTGTLIAPLGFAKGFTAIVIGHIIGCSLLFLAGLIGAKTEKSAMETVEISFGKRGTLLFSILNVLQLVGWTAVMVVSGASAANMVFNIGGEWVWSLIIGGLIVVWIIVEIKKLDILNMVAMAALFLLTVILSFVVFKDTTHIVGGESEITFGAAVELSVAMPLSWLPLISDYTRKAKKPFASTLASSVTYFVISCWMYVIGMGAAIFTGETNVVSIMIKAGLGLAALIVVVFSTVTTTYLDAYSAGVSMVSINSKFKEKLAAIAVSIVGVMLAIFTPITRFEDFLYIIGSVFAPMIAIQVTDYFILKKDYNNKNAGIKNLVIWVVGFIIYRLFMNIDTPAGYTFPVMLIIGIICIIADKIKLK